MGGAVLIIDLHELDFGELFEVAGQQVRDRIRCTGTVTSPCEVDMRDVVDEFKSTVACEAICQIDPAIGEFFGSARTFEVFIQQQSMNTATAHIADTRHLERRQVVGVAEGVHKVEIDPHI